MIFVEPNNYVHNDIHNKYVGLKLTMILSDRCRELIHVQAFSKQSSGGGPKFQQQANITNTK
jgi:hypothetical protein